MKRGDPVASLEADPVQMSLDLVLRKALEIIDQNGVEQLSMRRLGQTLERDPMTLYRYADNKTALLDGVVELVMSEWLLNSSNADWVSQLRHMARSFRELALAHPNVVPLLVTRPLATPLALRPRGTLRPLEAILELLTNAGFSNMQALHVYRAFTGFIYGHVLNELQELVENEEETDDLLRLGLHRLPIREFPLLRGLSSDLANYDGAAELERGLDILISGLQTQLPPSITQRDSRRKPN